MSITLGENHQAFRVSGNDLFQLAADTFKFEANKLSPLSVRPDELLEVSSEVLKLCDNPSFVKAVACLSKPGIRLSIRVGGKLMKPERFTVYGMNVGKETRLISVHEDEGLILIITHKDIDTFCDWFVSAYGSDTASESFNYIVPEIPLETLLCIFNLIDLYKRTYLADMLNFKVIPVQEVYEDEYIALLERAAQSGDVRWLMPSLFVLVPGFEQAAIEFKKEHLEYVRSMEFFMHSRKKENGRPVLLLGTSAMFMGMEFTHLWSVAAGFEASILEDNTIRQVSRHFLAPTVETNHFITLLPSPEGKLNALHETLTFKALKDKLKKLLV